MLHRLTRFKAQSGTPASPREVELKFQLLPGSRGLLEAASVFSGIEAKKRHLVTTYYDTADGLLYKAGLTLRIRQSEGTFVQTVKSEPIGNGVAADRGEWEWTVERDEPDLDRLRTIPELADVAHAASGTLKPAFVTDILRTSRTLRLDGAAIVEVAFDEGRILAGVGHEPVNELELELKSGVIAPAYQLAAELHSLAPFWLLVDSKAARGSHLLTGLADGARKARQPRLRRSLSAAAGLYAILNETLGHLIANSGPTLRGDGEGVHQMRAALRRCRAALNLFDPLLSRMAAHGLAARLQSLGKIFGTARDWDVFCFETLPAAMAEQPTVGLRDLKAAAEAERLLAHRAVQDSLRGQEFTALVLDLAVWMEAGVTPSALSDDGRMTKHLEKVAPALLARVADRARRRGRHAESLSPQKLHDLRKSVKKLVFDMEFLSALYPSAAARRYAMKCKHVLDILGEANDAVMTNVLARRLMRDSALDIEQPAEALIAWSTHRRHKALQGLGTVAARFRSLPRFWHS